MSSWTHNSIETGYDCIMRVFWSLLRIVSTSFLFQLLWHFHSCRMLRVSVLNKHFLITFWWHIGCHVHCTGDAAAVELGNGYKSAGRHKNWRVRDLAQLNAELRYVTSDRTSPVQRACISDAYIHLHKSRQHDQVQRRSAATQTNVRYAAFSLYLQTVITLLYCLSLTNTAWIIIRRNLTWWEHSISLFNDCCVNICQIYSTSQLYIRVFLCVLILYVHLTHYLLTNLLTSKRKIRMRLRRPTNLHTN